MGDAGRARAHAAAARCRARLSPQPLRWLHRLAGICLDRSADAATVALLPATQPAGQPSALVELGYLVAFLAQLFEQAARADQVQRTHNHHDVVVALEQVLD